MAQTVNQDLEAIVADLVTQVRALRTTNLTDRASVVNAAGASVPLSALAFGQVTALRAGVGVVSLTGVANTTQPGTTVPWQIGDPEVTVLVNGGKLRVDWASLLAVTGTQPRMIMSTQITYTGPPGAPGTAETVVVAPDYYRSLFAYTPNTSGAAMINSGTFGLHTGLAPGWYRVRSAYGLAYESTPTAPVGSADNPRIAAAPY